MKPILMKMLSLGIAMAVMTLPFSLLGQLQSPVDVALRYLEENKKDLKLTDEDIVNYVISDHYFSEHSGVTHVYMTQAHQGIEVFNAITNISIGNNGQVLNIGNRYVSHLKDRTNTTTPSLNAIAAVEAATTALKLTKTKAFTITETISNKEFTISDGGISQKTIPVKLKYQLMPDGQVRLAWDMSIHLADKSQDWWSLRIDALTGALLHKNNWTVKCQFHQHDGGFCAKAKTQPKGTAPKKVTSITRNTSGGSSYHVFPMPVESPNHGSRAFVSEPADANASPYGWHDTNGSTGAEYTITRGNNVHAYQDRNGNDFSSGDEPNGGAGLNFDAPLDLDQEPDAYTAAAVINLFYWNNMIHDVWYQYGLNEAGGSFQQNNYGNGGFGNDYVQAQAQDDFDGGSLNNANFATPPDGTNPTMQMYLWERRVADLFSVTSPENIAGGYEVQQGGFGGDFTTVPITGELIITDDGTLNETMGCNAIVNDIAGKIAIIDRGECEFGVKALNAENAGAIAVIICNNQAGLLGMGAGAVGDQVTIPAVMLGQADCAAIRVYIESEGVQVNFEDTPLEGATYLDGDFDNGIICHEFGHGISNRLTAGPSNTGCLSNDEQMGEGWSDWFALAMTVEEGDFGEMVRGTGTYADSQPLDGRGIRSYPYSTDMGVNPHTYKNVGTEVAPHGVGSVWCAMIWDLYWAMAKEHSFDADIKDGTGGNNMAMHLVMEGMAMQPCNPGFVDGRNAIIAADEAMYNGENKCLIWEVFARRGLGFSANQGSNDNHFDGTEAFDLPTTCRTTASITKLGSESVLAGENITYTFEIANYTDAELTGVTVTDMLPTGTTFVNGSGDCGATASGGEVTMNVGTLGVDEVLTCSFEVSTDLASFTTVSLFDDMENGDDAWITFTDLGSSPWSLANIDPFSGNMAWFIADIAEENNQSLILAEAFTVSGTQPALRFKHNYNTEHGIDGGAVEVSTDFETWFDMGDFMLKNGYTGQIQSGEAFTPGRHAFWGNSNGYVETIVSLEAFQGQEIYIRFRFGSDAGNGGFAWIIDDVEVVDLYNVTNEACLNVTGMESICATTPNVGTVISDPATALNIITRSALEVLVFPNPTKGDITIKVLGESTGKMNVRVISIDGKTVMNKTYSNVQEGTNLSLDLSNKSAGVYFVKMTTDDATAIKRVVVQK